jgi:hypothetical protein
LLVSNFSLSYILIVTAGWLSENGVNVCDFLARIVEFFEIKIAIISLAVSLPNKVGHHLKEEY